MTVRGASRLFGFTFGASQVESGLAKPIDERTWWRLMEMAVTGGILLLMTLSVANSLYTAGWVAQMPDLRLTGALGIVAGAALASRRVRWYAGLLAGLVLGVFIGLWQVIALDTLGGQAVFFDRFKDFWFRLEDWFYQAFHSGITTDNLPFIAFLVLIVWVSGFLGAYGVARWRTAWPALIAMGIILGVNVSYLDDRQWNLSFGFFLTGGALLVMRTALLRRMDRWRATGTAFPDFISLSLLGVTMLAIVALLTVSRVVPRPDESRALNDAWDWVSDPFEGLNDDFRRIFAGIDADRGAPVHSFDDFFVLQGDVNPGEGIVLRASATEPGLLRGASYDEYTGRGWRQSESTQRSVTEGEEITESGDGNSSVYADRRDVAVRLSVERSPSVLFTFGLPDTIDQEVLVDEVADTLTTIDLTQGAAAVAGSDLEEAFAVIETRRESGDLTAGEVIGLIPPQYSVVGVEPDSAGATPTSVTLRSRPPEPDVLAVRGPERLRAGFTYEARGTVSEAAVPDLQAVGDSYPLWVRERFLQLPERISETDRERMQALAADAASGAATPYDIAAAIEGYLCCSGALDENGNSILDDEGNPRVLYAFTTAIDLPEPGQDSVSWFLFENVGEDGLPIGGYYDYHASAMAVLLRTLGVPARVSTGFVLNAENFDERTENYIVRGRDAYAWVEVFFPGYGWVDFDPTPTPTGSEELPVIGGTRLARQRLLPIDADLVPLPPTNIVDVNEALAALDQLLAQGAQSPVPLRGQDGLNLWYLWGPLLAMGALAGALGSGALAWRLSLRGLGPAEREWAGTHRLARWSGLRADPSATPAEYARHIDRALRTPSMAARIAEAYAAVRFGRKALSPDQSEELRGDWRGLRSRLLRRTLHLPQPAPPERDPPPES